MKHKVNGGMAAVVLAMALAVPMFAQQAGPMKVKVPFNFVVENERVPSGDYTIEKIANGRLRIYSSDGKFSASVVALPTQRNNELGQAHFIFHQYGSEYFLARIWTPGQTAGWEFLQGKLENELAKKGSRKVELATLIGH